MKFSIRAVSLAALAVCACGAAQAQVGPNVTLYGIAAVEVAHVSNVNTTGRPGSQTRLDDSQDTNSRIGFKGREVIGGGINTIFDLESRINMDTGTATSTFWNRGAWVGLETPYGTITAGRQWDISDGINGTYFVFGGYSIFRLTEFDYISDLDNNSVKYVSPVFSGLQISGLVAAGENVTGRILEIGADYKNAGFQAGATYRTQENVQKTAKDKLATVGVSYPFGTVRVHGGYADSKLDASLLPETRGYDLGIDWAALPAVQVTLDYVGRDVRANGNDSHFIRGAAYYNLSKRSSIFVNIIGLTNKGTASQAFYGNGAPGKDQNFVSLGLKHLF